jgi:hypothetical protein
MQMQVRLLVWQDIHTLRVQVPLCAAVFEE